MNNESMMIDLRGKIGNTKLPYTNCLFPLFEAIINSVHAIQDRRKGLNGGGRIDITIDRDIQKTLSATSTLPEITGFTIVDDGVGFTERNFRSFLTSDSTYKQKRGGKGLGRMLWLKAFGRAEIESYYGESGKHWHRVFDFALSQQGIEKHSVTEVPSDAQRTTVRLVAYKKPYRREAPKTAAPIARRVIEHCLEFFALKTAPTITLHDIGIEDINLNRLFEDEIHIATEQKHFSIGSLSFSILHVMVKATAETEHSLHFCADMRSVRSLKGEKLFANVETPLHNDGQPFVYAGYVSSKYLDDRAINERTQFAIFDKDDSGFFSEQELAWRELVSATAKEADAFLEQFTAPVKERKIRRITEFVMEKATQYRALLKHKQDKIERIPAQITDEKLDIELYKIDQEYDAELRVRSVDLLANGDLRAAKWAEHKKELEQFVEEWNEHGMAKLARHIVYRKATLRFLYARLKMQPEGEYSLEETMHEVIFPLKQTSDDLRADQMNLWILDEKLAYHYYLASEIPFRKMEVIDVDSKHRPDILIFDRPFAFADSDEPFRSIIIVEFKRPERDDYRDDDPKRNPIVQVFDYVEKIRDGKAKDRHQNTINVGGNIPVYAYIVCDKTESLRRQARNSNLTVSPDGDGYFGYNREVGIYIEIMSYKKLLGDATRRNERFFDELGIGRSCTS